jgi:hypothetical protein
MNNNLSSSKFSYVSNLNNFNFVENLSHAKSDNIINKINHKVTVKSDIPIKNIK